MGKIKLLFDVVEDMETLGQRLKAAADSFCHLAHSVKTVAQAFRDNEPKQEALPAPSAPKKEKPLTDAASRVANYSNEGGIGYTRYQKNIMGMWLVNRLREELCPQIEFGEVVRLAEESSCEALVDANAPEFLSPRCMKEAFDKATENRLKTPGDYFRCAYRSLAFSYKKALEELESATGKVYERLYIVGGGARNEFLNQLTGHVTGKQVTAMPIEATALGNLKIQLEGS